jgi:hypothetical protein
MRTVYWIALVLMCYSPVKADVCSAVLEKNLVNASDNQYRENVSSAVVEHMCKVQFSDEEKFKDQATSIGIKYKDIFESLVGSFGYEDTESGRNSAYERICTGSSEQRIRNVELSSTARVQDFVVSAWLKCVTDTKSVAMMVTEKEDLDGFLIRIVNKRETAPDFTAFNLILAGDKNSVTCDPLNYREYRDQSNVLIGCSKDPNKAKLFGVTTNWGGGEFGEVKVRGRATTYEALQEQNSLYFRQLARAENYAWREVRLDDVSLPSRPQETDVELVALCREGRERIDHDCIDPHG